MKCDYCKECKSIDFPIWNGIRIMCDDCQYDAMVRIEEEKEFRNLNDLGE